MIISTEQLNTFYAVALEKNFSRAAEKLFRTQPAVSQSIHSLEDQLGQPLFLRQGRTTTLTQAGQILLEHVEEVFETLERGRFRLETLKDLKGGRLTISTSDTTACYLLPEVLSAFRKGYPEVEVNIRCKPSPLVAEQVLSHEADIGIVTLPLEHPKLASEHLIIREDVAICSPDNPLRGRSRISFAELVHYPLLLLDRGSNTRSYIDQRLNETGLKPRITMELGSIEVVKRLVQLDFGVSIVPRISVREELERGTLAAMTIFKKKECRTLGMVYPAKGIFSPAAQVFVNMLKDYFRQKDST
ncbi:MAG: LysR family transcriptional regulator [Deltaproteobacteria bacterium]|nr:LysR family transcriptional regulator [Deltaproteobacteria bacterium]